MSKKNLKLILVGTLSLAAVAALGGCNKAADGGADSVVSGGGRGGDGDGDGDGDFTVDVTKGGGSVDEIPGINPADVEETGFTRFEPSSDSVIYYVSDDGDDGNSGTSPSEPLRTADAALDRVRDGEPDWVLFKRGDTFAEGLGQLKKSGRSAEAPMVLGSYGASAERPTFHGGFETKGAGSAPEKTSFLAIVGLNFYSIEDDPAVADSPDGGTLVSWLRGGDDLWIEDCVFQFGQVSFQDIDDFGLNVTFFRSQFLDSYNTEAHSQGLFARETEGLVIDECLFDHNGWNEEVGGADPTIFSHNIYIQNGTKNNVITGNVIMRGSSHGLQARAGGRIEDNFCFRNPINLLLGGGTKPEPEGVTGTVLNNVILQPTDLSDEHRRGWGIDLENIASATVDGNIGADCLGSMCRLFNDTEIEAVTYGDNLDLIDETPDASLLTYFSATPSLEFDSLEDFYAAIRGQSRFSWNPDLTAEAINAYFVQELK